MKLNHKLFLITITTVISLTFVQVANAQRTVDEAFGGDSGLTAEELAARAGLGVTDPQEIIANIINITLGFLGIIAVGLIIYAGFRWMTSGGDPNKIDTAKRILTAGAIGLVIILSAFGIAQFVIRVLLDSTGGGGGDGGTTIPPGGLSGGTLEIVETYPENNQMSIANNVITTYLFNRNVSGTPDNATVRNATTNTDISGVWQTRGKVLEFIPASMPIGADGDSIQVQFWGTVGGRRLETCPNASAPCVLRYQVGAGSASNNPNISDFSVDSLLCTSFANVINVTAASTNNPSHLRLAELYIVDVSDVLVDQDIYYPDAMVSFNFDGSGYTAGETITMKVIVWDADGNFAEDTLSIEIQDCVHPVIELITPFGGYCEANPNTYCRTDATCDTVSLGDVCNVTEPNGAVSNLITVHGHGFGDTEHEFYFTDNADNLILAQLADDVNGQCSDPWTDTQIIAVVPSNTGAIKPVGLITSDGLFDASNDNRGDYRKNFILNTIERPGLCQVTPAVPPNTKFGDNITLDGIKFNIDGSDAGSVVFGDGVLAGEEHRSLQIQPGFTALAAQAGIPNIKAGTTTVSVVNTSANDERSNALNIDITETKKIPFITEIKPEYGHPGDYLTITGGNFGSVKKSTSHVWFGDANPIDAIYEFPDQCLVNELWQDTQIIVKVPSLGDGSYRVKVELDGDASNSEQYSIRKYCQYSGNNCSAPVDCNTSIGEVCVTSPKPGLCRISPNNGPVGTEVSYYGERFGSADGTVEFFDGVVVNPPTSWEMSSAADAADTAVANVPNGAQPGETFVTSNAGLDSNPLQFAVGNCLDAGPAGLSDPINPACTVGSPYCCGQNKQLAGSCMATEDLCGDIPGSGFVQYYFEFSTGAGLGVIDESQRPHVIEECDRSLGVCTDKHPPSPSPWTPQYDDNRNEIQACVNAQISVRFDKILDSATLTPANVVVKSCEEGVVVNGNSSVSRCSGVNLFTNPGTEMTVTNTNTGQEETQVLISLNSNLTQETWYRVTLTTGITTDTGIPMSDDYTWNFKTRNNNNPCTVGCVEVVPDPYTKKELGVVDTNLSTPANDPYVATTQADDNACVMIKSNNKDWDWSSTYVSADAQNTYVNVSQIVARPQALVTALRETDNPVDQYVHIIATEAESNLSDFGRLDINLPDFEVVAVWPINQCATVCTNAAVGVKFSTPVRADTASRVSLFECNAGDCAVLIPAAGININPRLDPIDNTIINFNLSGALFKNNQWYRAGIIVGPNGVLNNDNKEIKIDISSPNYFFYGYSQTPFYSWTFKTGDKFCAVDSIDLQPNPGIATLIGEEVNFRATPQSDEACFAAVEAPTDGLVAHWKFDEGAGTTVNDSTTNNNDGSFVGSPAWVGGVDGQALSFSAGNRVVINNPNFGITDQVTVSLWAYGSKNLPIAGNHIILGQGPVSDRILLVHLPYWDGSNNVYWETDDGLAGNGGQRINKTPTEDEYKGSWQNWAFTKNSASGEMKIYLNGSLWHSGSGLNRGISDINKFQIASSYDGLVDDVRVYNRALSATEIWQLNSLSSTFSQLQKLRDSAYDWQWDPLESGAAANPVAYITNSNWNASRNIPLHLNYQPVTAVGQGNVTTLGSDVFQQEVITSSILDLPEQELRADTADFRLMCGFVQDDECRYANGNDAYTTHGVGANSCCYPRPSVISSKPADDDVNVCRNAMISATFDTAMDEASFNNNIFLAAYYGNEPCPPGTQFLRLALADGATNEKIDQFVRGIVNGAASFIRNQPMFKPIVWAYHKLASVSFIKNIFNSKIAQAQGVGNRWCAVPGTLSASTNRGQTTVYYAPTQLLNSGTHALLIRGDSDSQDEPTNQPRGVVSRAGVTMRGECNELTTGTNDCIFNQNFYGKVIRFETLPTTALNQGVCTIDHVAIEDAAHLFRRNDDNANDNNYPSTIVGPVTTAYNSVDDNDREFTAFARSSSAQDLTSIPNIYAWNWDENWTSDNTDIASTRPEPDNIPVITGADKEIIFTTYQLEYARTFVRQSLNIIDNTLNIPGPNRLTGATEITVFICANPWPPYVANEYWQPYRENLTKFEFFYCRDEGEITATDDLPFLFESFNLPSNDLILKELLFTQAFKPSVPQDFSSFGGGMGDVNKSGEVDVADVTAIKQVLNGSRQQNNPLINWSVADVNLDGVVTVEDAILISQYLAGVSNSIAIDLYEGNKVLLRWKPVANTDYYNIYMKKEGGSYGVPLRVDSSNYECLSVDTDGDASTAMEQRCFFMIDNLENYAQYYFRVSSVVNIDASISGSVAVGREESDLSNEVMAMPRRTSELSIPQNLSATVSGDAIQLFWGDVLEALDIPDVRGYRISHSSGASVDADDEFRVVIGKDVKTYSWNIPANRRNETHYFKLSALGENDSNTSPSSSIIKIDIGPIGYWKINEGSGVSIADSSLFVNGGTFSSANAPEWTGNFLKFDPQDDTFIQIPAKGQLNLGQSGGFTLSLWVKPAGLATNRYNDIFGYEIGGWNRRYPSIFINNNTLAGVGGTNAANSVYTSFGFNNGNACSVNTINDVIRDGEWNSIVVVYENTNHSLRVYVDGQLQKLAQGGSYQAASDTSNFPLLTNQTSYTCEFPNGLLINEDEFDIGRVRNSALNTTSFDGQIAEVKVYNYPIITESDITKESSNARFK
ncbi:MAG: LamG-like jellyroll fold domain-containing protein [bacterium]|nr:LamG-like jellyroll fold domain-containing protein [bacterium]